MKKKSLRFIAIVLLLVLPMAMMSLFARKPDLGVSGGQLTPCPDKPNCVCSQSTGSQHSIQPLRFDGSAELAMERLRDVLAKQPRMTTVVDEGDYLRAEARSLIFRFVDDLEFVVDRSQKLIHLRSASRLGHSDLGVNRKRAESIRSAFNDSAP